MESEQVLKKISRIQIGMPPTPGMFKKMSRSELAIEATESTLKWVSLYLKNHPDDMYEFKEKIGARVQWLD